MSNIAKLSGKSAQKYYYEKDPIFNQNGENENLTWGGKGAENLGLQGKAEQEDFKDILEGKKGDIELRDQSRKTSGDDRKAFDLILSAPKSVSHASLVLDKKDIVEAHKEAVAETMKFVESLAQARVYNEKNKRIKVDTNNITYASALHSTSRATADNVSDPSLHSHNIIMNTTQTSDGKFMSLNTDKIFENQNLIKEVYKQNLAHNLQEKGYALDFDKKGNFELKGYDKTVIENFSKRKNEITEQVKLMKEDPKFEGKSDKELRDYAQHNYKAEKQQDITKEELTKNWDKQHKENGITSKEDLEKNLNEAKESLKYREKLTVEEVLKISAENLTDKESYFTKETLLKESLRVNNGDNKVEDIREAINDIKKTGQKEDYELKKITVNGEDRYTTKEIYDIEKENRELLSKATKSEALLTKEEAEKGIANFEEKMGWKMTETQRESAFNALTTTDKFSSIQGDAGTGKTTMLDAVRHSLEFNNKDSQSLGVLAPTGKAASGAKAESGIDSSTVDSYLIQQDILKKASSEQVKQAKEVLKESKNESSKEAKKQQKTESKNNSSKDKDNLSESKNETKDSSNKQNLKESSNNDKKEEDRFKTSKVDLDKEMIKKFSKSMKENEVKETKTKGMALSISSEYQKIKLGGGKLEITKLDDETRRFKTTTFNKDTGFVETNRRTTQGTRKVEIGEQHNEHKLKITDKFKNGTSREIEISKTNLFGKKTEDSALSKKASDLIFKNDETKFKNISADKKFSETSKKETSILSVLKQEENSTKNFNGKHHIKTSEKNFKGLGIEFNSTTQEKKGNILGKEGRTLEFKRETNLKIFGKEIDTSFLNSDYSKKEITLESFKQTFDNFMSKVDNMIKGEKDRESYLIKDTSYNSKNEIEKQTIIKSESLDNNLREVNIIKQENNKIETSKQIQEKDKSVEISSHSLNKKDLSEKSLKDFQNLKENKSLKEETQQGDKKMIFVDESSMLSAKKLNALLKDAEENGHKISFIGDTKQLLSVQQGKAFNEVQELTNTTHMNQGMRQSKADAETKKVVDSFAKKDVKTAIETLDKQEKFIEMKDKQEIVDYVSSKISKDEAYKNTVVLASTKNEVKDINDATREKLFGKAEHGTKTKVLEDKRLDLVDKMKIDNYEKTDKVSMKIKTESNKERFATYEVAGVNKEKNELLLKSDKKSFTVNLQKEHGNITQVEKVVDKSFAVNDKVMNLKNDKKQDVMNGEIGYVKNIDEKKGIMSVEFGKGKDAKTIDYDLKSENKHLDHAYAMSIHKSQGITEQKAIAIFDTKNKQMNNQNLAYVASSRHKEEFELITNDKKELVKQIEKEQEKASTTDSKESKEDLKAIKEINKSEYEKLDLKDSKQEESNKKDLKEEFKENSKEQNQETTKKEEVYFKR